MAMALGLIKTLLIIFIILCLLLYVFQDRMIFFPQPLPSSVKDRWADHEFIVDHQGVRLQGWLFEADNSAGEPLVIYFGGNAEEVSANFQDLDRFGSASLLLMNYRGYGESQGKPSEAALLDDGLATVDAAVKRLGIRPDQIVLMGRSLGSGVAVHIAANRSVRGVILVTPFDSLVNVAKKHYPVFPVSFLMRHRFDSLSLAPRVDVPLLALIAEHDEIIPESNSRVLVENWKGPVRAVVVPGAGHNDISLNPGYWTAIQAFLADMRGQLSMSRS